MNMVFKIK